MGNIRFVTRCLPASVCASLLFRRYVCASSGAPLPKFQTGCQKRKRLFNPDDILGSRKLSSTILAFRPRCATNAASILCERASFALICTFDSVELADLVAVQAKRPLNGDRQFGPTQFVQVVFQIVIAFSIRM